MIVHLADEALETRTSVERWTAWMLKGDFERAWRETDRIELARRGGERAPGQLVWDGSSFRVKTVLLRSDHALAAAIPFIRYAPLLKAHCSSLLVKAQPVLGPLLRLQPVDEVLSREDPDPQFDVQIE